MTTDLYARAAVVRLILLDVDGVLTDGTVYIGAGGDEMKGFSIRDGAAIQIAKREGLLVGVLSGRPSGATARRAAELGLSLVKQTGPDKRQAFREILDEHALTEADVAYMGDDLLDLPVLGRVGLSAAPADAVSEVRDRVHWVAGAAGGRGAVRELIELILRARGRWEPIVEGYLA